MRPKKSSSPRARGTTNTKPAKAAKAKGRPSGAKTARRDKCDVLPSRCQKCHSTKRTPYSGSPRVVTHNGTAPDGKPYDRIIIRHTRCKDCGQARIDRFFEHRGKARALPLPDAA